MHFYFFISSRKSDKLSTLTVVTTTLVKATALAQLHFIKKGYKGKPKLAI